MGKRSLAVAEACMRQGCAPTCMPGLIDLVHTHACMLRLSHGARMPWDSCGRGGDGGSREQRGASRVSDIAA